MAKIMIADDDVFLHRVMARVLGLGGHQVVAHAYNGLEAFKKYANLNDKPDVILMDHRMPVMDGVHATKEILRVDPHAKILFISADESAKEEALKAGAAGFLVKPVRSTMLFKEIDEVLSK